MPEVGLDSPRDSNASGILDIYYPIASNNGQRHRAEPRKKWRDDLDAFEPD